MYFKGGEKIESPVDYNGNLIKEGDILTHSYFDKNMDSFFKTYCPKMTPEEIELTTHKPSVIVRWNDEGFFYGEGIEKKLYMHDFMFKFAKIVSNEKK